MRRILLAIALIALASKTHADARGFNNDPFGTHAERPDTVVAIQPESQSADPVVASMGLSKQGVYIVSDSRYYAGPSRKHGVYFGYGTGSVSVSDGYATAFGTGSLMHFGFAAKASDILSYGAGLEYTSAVATATVGDPRYGYSTANATGSSTGPHLWIDLGSKRGFAVMVELGNAGFGAGAQFRYGHEKKPGATKKRAAAPAVTTPTETPVPHVQPKIYGR